MKHIPIVRSRPARSMVWLLPSHPSEAAHCTSTGDHLVYPLMPLPLFPFHFQSKIGTGAVVVHCACLTSSLTSQRTGSRVGSTAAVERGPSQGARSGSKEPTWLSVLPLPYFVFRPLPEPDKIILVLDPDKPADNQGEDEKFLPLFVHDRHDRKAPEGCQRATG